jgi:type II secretory pathway component PulJ
MKLFSYTELSVIIAMTISGLGCLLMIATYYTISEHNKARLEAKAQEREEYKRFLNELR